MVADRGVLWSVEHDDTLFKTDKDGNFEQIGPRGILSDVPDRGLALDNTLYVVENGTLYRTRG